MSAGDEGEGEGLGTLAVHAGHDPAGHLGAAVPPLYQSATFVAPDTSTIEAINAGSRRGFVYSRIRNPTVLAAEQRLAALEGAESAVAFASGMAAVAGALAPFLTAGDEVVALPDLYGGTRRYLAEVLPRQGVAVRRAADGSAGAVGAALGRATRIILAETPTNPLVRVIDLAALAALARGAGAMLVVDGTLGSPMNQRPLALGADLVIHSVSKYLNGHGDVIGGAVLGSRALTRAVRSHQQAAGGIMEPFAAWLLLRGLATYPLRMARHNASGLAVARFLAAHPRVVRVHYPGLPDHPDHALARRQMQGFGGLVSFEAESAAAARRIVDACRLFAIGPSIGGIESLCSQPGNTSHHALAEAERLAMGITPALVRLAVGIETTADLVADLARALEAA